MEVCTKDSSTKMKYQAKESTTGLIRKHTEAPGSRTKCTAKVHFNGLMASCTRACSKMISAKATESSPGRTEESTTESGKMENRMVKASSLIRKTNREEASGRVVKILNG
jgi:hypothetical protein